MCCGLSLEAICSAALREGAQLPPGNARTVSLPLYQEVPLMSDWWVWSQVSQLIGGLKRRRFQAEGLGVVPSFLLLLMSGCFVYVEASV